MRIDMRHTALLRCLGLLCLGGLAAIPLRAGTIALDARGFDRMAVISGDAPRLSWAASGTLNGARTTTGLYLEPDDAFLFHADLSMIPAGQRIVSAELLVPVSDRGGHDPRFFLWRMIAEWSMGVCWDARMLLPEKATWMVPGARGPGLDRGLEPSAVVRLAKNETVTINVTGDVALWYAGAAPNQGWMMTVDDPGNWVAFHAPFWADPGYWTLQVTYEPEVEE